jgi:putative peptidoglycan lipid II flippase
LIYCVENAINIIVAIAIYPVLGVQGLALSWSIGYTAGTVIAVWDLRRRAGGIEGRSILTSTSRIAIATSLMTVGVIVVSRAIGGDSGVQLLARVGVSVAAGVSLYLLAARILHVPELADLFRTGRNPA